MKPFDKLTPDIIRQFEKLKTPCFVLDERVLKENGKILKQVQEDTGCKILLAQKAFSNYDLYPVIEPYCAGSEASGLYEARLGKEEMPSKEVHVFSAAYRQDEIEQLVKYVDHVVFNTPHQLKKYGKFVKEHGCSIGLRVNPQISTQDHGMYDPCAPGSRLGSTKEMIDNQMDQEALQLLDGIHFHTLCEQNSDALEMTLKEVMHQFDDLLRHVKWINMGGGHHITRDDYDIECLKKCIALVQSTYGIEVYLEPGEAWALNAGYLCTRVLDTFRNGETQIALVDMSPTCHTPDVLEVPYTPPLYKEGGNHPYRLGGPSCLSGDIMGDYLFDHELKEDEFLIFGDMAIYSTCKTNTFNGMPLPSIYVLKQDGSLKLLKEFNYNDFKSRLGS